MKPKKVLLVDDDKAYNFLNRIVLRDNEIDCPVEEANDGQQALDYIAKNEECPDVILLDLNMPGIDGFQFLKEYEARGKCCGHSKIFMLTSSMREEDREAALSNKFVKGYFDKPLSSSHIAEILAMV